MSDHQLPLTLGGSSDPALVPVSRLTNRKAKPATPIKRQLPIVQQGGFEARADVPKNRRHCPDERPCVHLLCKWNLARVDASERAGRPGLSSVPRDASGRTLSVAGVAGQQRAEATFMPLWLELERTCKVRIDVDETGQITIEPHDPVTNEQAKNWSFRKRRLGSWRFMEKRLFPGEPIDVYDYMTDHFIAQMVLTKWNTFVFDRELPSAPRVTYAALVRVREVASCGLDLIEQHGGMTNEQIGEALGGKHRTLIARDNKRALLKVKAAGGDVRDLVEA